MSILSKEQFSSSIYFLFIIRVRFEISDFNYKEPWLNSFGFFTGCYFGILLFVKGISKYFSSQNDLKRVYFSKYLNNFLSFKNLKICIKEKIC